jgi:hypothetical protein
MTPEAAVTHLVCRMVPEHAETILQALGILTAPETAPGDTCRNGHPRTPQNTRWRTDTKTGNQVRYCKDCATIAAAKRTPKPASGNRAITCRNGHPWTTENTIWYGETRRCRTCKQTWERTRRKRSDSVPAAL